jgi:hypothetical protein
MKERSQMNNNSSPQRLRPIKVLVVMSEDTGDAAGFLCHDPSVCVEVIWNFTPWEDIPRGYKTLAREWGFMPDEEIEE